ncbi:hypothetical protein, unlikely [Trypanosoma congolense IL3000]|nr:hypothetical protein, unlikely [Trypanosoma congolense IL3000]
MEVFTGMAVFLRTVATGQRYGDAGVRVCGEGRGTLFAEGYGLDVWTRVFSLVQDVRGDMERFMVENAACSVEPEFECWEALLVTLRCVLDYCVVRVQGSQPGTERDGAERLFESAAELRNKLIDESRTRFGGRMRVLWLQEA